MDRLITHLKITPLEAYGHIEHILQQVREREGGGGGKGEKREGRGDIENVKIAGNIYNYFDLQVNAVTASLWTTEIIQQKQEKEEEEGKNGGKTQATVDEDEVSHSHAYFRDHTPTHHTGSGVQLGQWYR